MAEVGVPFMDNEFVSPLPEGARWGDISDGEELEQAAAAADGEDEFETDPKRLTARQQQIDFGKNTLGYESYLQAVPKNKRKLRGKDHDPATPDITQKMSKRTWDGIVKAWRRHLHKFDNVEGAQPAEAAAAGAGGDAAGAVDMQVDAPAAMPDAPRSGTNAAGGAKRWRASGNKRRGSKQQSNISSQRIRQDDTASQQQQRKPSAEQDSAPQPQHQQQADERSRQHNTHGSRSGSHREEDSSRGHGSGGSEARRYHHHTNSRRHDSRSRHSHQSSRDSKRDAAAAEYGADGERECGQPPRHGGSNATRSSREQQQGHGSGSGGHRAGHRSQQQHDRREPQARDAAHRPAAAEPGRITPDAAAAGSGSRQLTPAKRGSSSQADVDKRPAKHY